MFNVAHIEWVGYSASFIYSNITYNDIYSKVKNNKLYWMFTICYIWSKCESLPCCYI